MEDVDTTDSSSSKATPSDSLKNDGTSKRTHAVLTTAGVSETSIATGDSTGTIHGASGNVTVAGAASSDAQETDQVYSVRSVMQKLRLQSQARREREAATPSQIYVSDTRRINRIGYRSRSHASVLLSDDDSSRHPDSTASCTQSERDVSSRATLAIPISAGLLSPLAMPIRRAPMLHTSFADIAANIRNSESRVRVDESDDLEGSANLAEIDNSDFVTPSLDDYISESEFVTSDSINLIGSASPLSMSANLEHSEITDNSLWEESSCSINRGIPVTTKIVKQSVPGHDLEHPLVGKSSRARNLPGNCTDLLSRTYSGNTMMNISSDSEDNQVHVIIYRYIYIYIYIYRYIYIYIYI